MKTPKLPDILINTETPFQNCKLNRKQYADNLTQLLNNYSDGFVLALNNSWGAGKTTFIKMWNQKLIDEGHKTIYFNAWENDFEDDALAAILGEVKPLFEGKNKTLFNRIKKSAAFLGKNAAPIIIGSLATKVFDSNTAGEISKALTESSVELFQKNIDTYQKKKTSLLSFKSNLKEMVSELNEESGKPLVFFIDEIDRCRPDYAVEVLEKVKHLFTVPGIVFVLSIDKLQLCNAIRGFYGSDQMNAEEYLKRFVDIEFSLPDPDIEDLVRFLFEHFDFSKTFDLERVENDEFWSFSTWLLKSPSLPVRTVEKLFCQTKLALMTSKTRYHFPALVLLILYLKNFHSAFYLSIVRNDLSIQDLSTELIVIFKSRLNKRAPSMFIRAHAQLIVVYARRDEYDPKRMLLNDDETLKIKDEYDNLTLTNSIKEFLNNYPTENISISNILNMIELSDRFNF